MSRMEGHPPPTEFQQCWDSLLGALEAAERRLPEKDLEVFQSMLWIRVLDDEIRRIWESL